MTATPRSPVPSTPCWAQHMSHRTTIQGGTTSNDLPRWVTRGSCLAAGSHVGHEPSTGGRFRLLTRTYRSTRPRLPSWPCGFDSRYPLHGGFAGHRSPVSHGTVCVRGSAVTLILRANGSLHKTRRGTAAAVQVLLGLLLAAAPASARCPHPTPRDRWMRLRPASVRRPLGPGVRVAGTA